jgi:hypothetical protein
VSDRLEPSPDLAIPLWKPEIPRQKPEILLWIYRLPVWKPEILLQIYLLFVRPEIPRWIYLFFLQKPWIFSSSCRLSGGALRLGRCYPRTQNGMSFSSHSSSSAWRSSEGS